MMAPRPFAWEHSYPPGLRWDASLCITTLPDLFDMAAAKFAERTALEFRDRTITYRQLARDVERFAAALMSAGLRAGEPLALYLPNTPYHPICFFGAAKAGLKIVHLSPLDAEREIAHKLADSGARTVVTTDVGAMLAMAQKLADAGLLDRVIVGEDAVWGTAAQWQSADAVVAATVSPMMVSFADFTAGAALPGKWPRITRQDIALLQYTGGTTGRPKAAILTHANLTAAVAIYDAWGQGQGMLRDRVERALCVLPLFHLYALTTVLLRHINYGNTILLRQRFDVEATLHDIEVERASVFPGVPTMWIALANHPEIARRDLSSLWQASSGGASLPDEVRERISRLTGLVLRGGWGMTETSPAGSNIPPGAPIKPGSIGLPMPGIEMEIVALDDPRRALVPGEVGEIRVRGPNVTAGYWNRPEETAAAFVDGWLLTGDIGHMDEDGTFFIVDRKKDMIISGGFNVYPQMIEQAIYEHPAVSEVLVIGVPDAYRGEAAKAFVALKPGAAPFTLEALQAFLLDKLGRHEMPTQLEFRPALPRSPVGKLSKVALRDEERRSVDPALRRSA